MWRGNMLEMIRCRERKAHCSDVSAVRLVIMLRPISCGRKLIDAWRSPQGKNIAELLAILKENEPVYYQHEMAA